MYTCKAARKIKRSNNSLFLSSISKNKLFDFIPIFRKDILS